MARRMVDWPPPEALIGLLDGRGRLTVRVTPGARSEALEIAGGSLVIRVRAKPKDGEANEAVLALLARALNVPRSSLALLRGATSREKVVQIAL
jgi:uncharacterized protein